MEIYESLGQQALVSIMANLIFIAMAFFALQALRLDQIFKKGRVFHIQLFYILMSIAIGSAVATFFLNFLTWSKQLPYMF